MPSQTVQTIPVILIGYEPELTPGSITVMDRRGKRYLEPGQPRARRQLAQPSPRGGDQRGDPGEARLDQGSAGAGAGRDPHGRDCGRAERRPESLPSSRALLIRHHEAAAVMMSVRPDPNGFRRQSESIEPLGPLEPDREPVPQPLPAVSVAPGSQAIAANTPHNGQAGELEPNAAAS